MEVRKNYVIVDFLGFPLDTEQRAIGWEPQSEQPIDEGEPNQNPLGDSGPRTVSGSSIGVERDG